MRILLCHFRIAETDGVSLEMDKWATVFKELGHEVYFLAGNSGGENSYIIPELHYERPENLKFIDNAYHQLKDYADDKSFEQAVLAFSKQVELGLESIVVQNDIDLLIPNNIWSLGFGIPAAMALFNVVKRLQLCCIAHHHDFYWERERYSNFSCDFVADFLRDYFPPKSDLIKHVVINHIAQKELATRKEIDSTVVPNVFDFSAPSWHIDEYNSDFRERIGLSKEDVFVLQATRVTERKAIELAIDVVAAMYLNNDTILYDGRKFSGRVVLVLAGLLEADFGYVDKLKNKASQQGVELLFINDVIEHARCYKGNDKCYSLWDAYVHCDIVTYPSILEGWGNQFLEAVFARKPVVVYEYPVYKTDIKNKGFEIISLGEHHQIDDDGLVCVDENIVKEAAQAAISVLTDNQLRSEMVEKNFAIGQKHFSYKNLKDLLVQLL